MTNYFCTLFNIAYFSRGIALYESLLKQMPNAHLFVFAFDDKTLILLKKLNLSHLTVISLEEFEDPELLAIKGGRTMTEYCWTCSPAIVYYVLKTYKVGACTYLDSDLYFFSSPQPLLDELGDSSISLIENRFTEKYDESYKLGVYCVQFMTFKNNGLGLAALKWWRDSCIKWCFNYFENGQYGDQKYLDDWCKRFEGVKVLKNLGGGVAPWNIQQYKISDTNGLNIIDNSSTTYKLIFYHFHQVRHLSINKIDIGIYDLAQDDIELLYKPYVSHLDKIYQSTAKVGVMEDIHGVNLLKPANSNNNLYI